MKLEFLSVNSEGYCKKCAQKPFVQNFEQMKAQRQHDDEVFNSQIGRINSAREQYDKDKNLENIIAVYEQVLLHEEVSWNAYNQRLALSEYYLKAGRNNDSWGMLNQLVMLAPDMN